MKNPAQIVLPVVIATMMSFIMSGAITAINLGVTASLPLQWLEAWAIAWPLAVVSILLVRPLAVRVTGWIVARIAPEQEGR